MNKILKVAKNLNKKTLDHDIEFIWSGLRKKYLVSIALYSFLNILQMCMSASIIVLNIYVTRLGNYLTEWFVAIIILVSIGTFFSSIAFFLGLRIHYRRNRKRYIMSLNELEKFKSKTGIYRSSATREARIVRNLAKIRSWKVNEDPNIHTT